jgi:hypothetical protein
MATFTLFLATLVGQIDADKRQLLQYISTASKTNADLSAHGRVEFRVLRKSDAGSGDVNDLPADAVERANGLFIFDARNAFLSLSYSDNELTSGYKEIDKNKHTMTTVPTTLLTDGKSTLLNVLDYDPKRGIIDRPEVQPDTGYRFFRGLANFIYPVTSNDLIKNPLVEDIRDVLNGDGGVEDAYIDLTKNQQKIAQLKLVMKREVKHNYVIDLDKGAITLEFREFAPNGTLVSEKLYGNLRKVDGGGWFPYVKRVNLPGPAISDFYLVSKLDFEWKPAERDFTLKFRAPVSFTDRATSTVQRGLKSYSLIERSKSPPKGGVKVELKEFAPPVHEEAGELPEPTYWRYVLPVGLVCAFTIGVWRFKKRRA